MLDEEPADEGRGARRESELRQREAEAQHHRQRLALYRARVLTGRPSSSMRLAELRRVSAGADARLAHVRTTLRDGSSKSATRSARAKKGRTPGSR